MSTRSELRDQVTAAIEQAQAIITAVAAGEYASASQYEADVNQVRRTLADLVVEIEAEWGNGGLATVVALRALGARLIELRARIAEGTTTLTTTIDRPTSLMELAIRWYADLDRWRELRSLNPRLRHPGFVPAGWDLVHHAR